MKCPVCGATDTRVIDSRSIKDETEIRRRRHCDACAHRFTTYERAEGAFPMVVKKDGRREPWDRDKLLGGLAKACEKRPVSIASIQALVDEIGRELGSVGEAEVPSRDIGERSMAALRQLDEVAYVRFASVYRSFKDIDEFMDELSELVRKRENDDQGERNGGG
jgi:transcriptional repressor NrdR